MIAELLELERIRGGRGANPVLQDLVPMLREVTESVQSKSPRVRVVSTPPAILLEVDGEKLRIVLRNLLENAMKYSVPQSGPVEVSAVPNGESVIVRVSDHGRAGGPASLRAIMSVSVSPVFVSIALEPRPPEATVWA